MRRIEIENAPQAGVDSPPPKGQRDRPLRRVDASHPTWRTHHYTPSGGIEAEYWVFIDVQGAAQLERASDLVVRHLRDWRTFYHHSHVEFIGAEPDQSENAPVTFKFAPLAFVGKKYTGHEMTTMTVRFDRREPLPDGNGWVIPGCLIDGDDAEGRRLPHHFTGPVRTEVRAINEPAQSGLAARVGIEVRDIWVDVKNNRRPTLPDSVATFIHLFRSAEGFRGLRKIVKKELEAHPIASR
jgi:hypothetical protein